MSIVMERERQQNDSLVNGQAGRRYTVSPPLLKRLLKGEGGAAE